MLMSGESGSRVAVDDARPRRAARGASANARSRNALRALVVVAIHLQVERQRRQRPRVVAKIGGVGGRAGRGRAARRRRAAPATAPAGRRRARRVSTRAGARRLRPTPSAPARARASTPTTPAPGRRARRWPADAIERKREHRPIEGEIEADRHREDVGGHESCNAPPTHHAISTPPAPPAAASTTASAQQLPDQSAARWRRSRRESQIRGAARCARASSRLATLAHAISSTRPTAASRPAARGSDVAVEHGMEAHARCRHDAGGHVFIGDRVFGAQPRIDGLDLRARFFDRAAVRKRPFTNSQRCAASLEPRRAGIVGVSTPACRRTPADPPSSAAPRTRSECRAASRVNSRVATPMMV